MTNRAAGTRYARALFDVALKESRVSSDEQVLSTLILSMCRPR